MRIPDTIFRPETGSPKGLLFGTGAQMKETLHVTSIVFYHDCSLNTIGKWVQYTLG
jgi:hypothetical protein